MRQASETCCQIAVLAAILVLLPSAVSAHRPEHYQVTCKEFRRSEPGAPAIVQEYLQRTNSSLIEVCSSGDASAYHEMGQASKHGDMCQLIGHYLELSHAGSSLHLEREESPPQEYMLATKSACPPPTVGRYAYIRDVTEDEVFRLSQIWGNAISSTKSFDRVPGVSRDVAPRLHSKIAHGKGADLRIVAITKEERFFFVPQEYHLNVRDPEDQQLLYYVTVTRGWLAWNYAISQIDLAVP